MTSTVLQDFRDRVEAFLKRTGMAISKFGRLAVNDASFVPDLRDGKRNFQIATIVAVDKFMAEYVASDDDDEAPAAPLRPEGSGEVKAAGV